MKEDFVSLVEAIKREECGEDLGLVLDVVDSAINSFRKYVNSVYSMEVKTPIIYARYDGDDLRDRIQNLDRSRRMCHEKAISSCKQLNRMCQSYGVKEFCPDTDDRYIIGDFCGKVVSEMFRSGTMERTKNIDDLIKQMTDTRSGDIPPKKLSEIER